MKRLPPLLLFSLGAILFLAQAAEDLPLIEKQLLDSVLNDYDNRIRPVGVDNGAVVVRVNTYIRDISNLDMQRGTADLQITFRQQWQDPRLAFQSKASADKIDYLSLTDRNVLWMPDLFFSNSHTEQTFELMKPNVLIRIYPDGSILFSQRIALTVRMVFDDHDYPFDSQVIPLKIASYGYTTNKLNILWKESDPVQVTKNLHLRDYNLHRFDTSYCTSRTNTGEYACIRMDLQLDRMKSSIYKQVFIPTACLVILAYLTFFIDHKQPTLRLLYPLIVFAYSDQHDQPGGQGHSQFVPKPTTGHLDWLPLVVCLCHHH
ncbi:Glutamate-gated chloride channel [Halotydeus destructor]|nr:Glutamate-gated chloride channel [Halotydeus destructor]